MEDIVGGSHWIDSYNSSWTREDLYLMLSVGGTQFLYEKLAANGELDTKLLVAPVLKAPRRASRWKVVDFEKKMVFPLIPRSLTVDAGFHFKNSIDVKDFEAMTSGLLELQVKQSRRILSQADIVSLINQKVQVFNRMGYAYRCIFQRKLKSPSSSREFQDQNTSNVPSSTRSSLGSIDTDRDRIGSQALIELGLTTGLALVFALMKQNWQQQQQNPGKKLIFYFKIFCLGISFYFYFFSKYFTF